jgi:replicative DNA helicase
VEFVSDVKDDKPCFAMTFSDGSTLVTDMEHQWGVERFYWKKPNWRYEVKMTAELLPSLHFSLRADGRKRFRYRVRNTAPLDMPNVALLLDPYLLGIWLGDGSTTQAAISSHQDDASHYVDAIEAAGHKTKVSLDKGKTVRISIDLRERLTTHCQRGHVFDIVGQASNGACSECLRLGHWRRKYGFDRNGNVVPPLTMFKDNFSSKLHALGVHGRKHIPLIYLRASIEQRFSVLQGLMDTDGTYDKRAGRCELTTVSDFLRDDFMELTRSLGFKPSSVTKRTTWTYKDAQREGLAYRIAFPVPHTTMPLFSLPRKRYGFKPATIDVGYRQIVSIEPVESRPVMCIRVANESHLFLAGRGMLPTYNTRDIKLKQSHNGGASIA